MKRAALLRRTELRSKRRKSDVPDWLFGYLLARDRECVPHKRLGAPGECFGRLTIEHVRDRDKPAAIELGQMLLARGFEARNPRHWPVLARALGALFIRSYERGERVHLAMVSRGLGAAAPRASGSSS